MLDKRRDMRGKIKIVDIESLMPKKHLLRKIDKVINFDKYMKWQKNTIVVTTEDQVVSP